MELDTIQLQTTWNDAAGSLNNNFAKIQQALVFKGITTYTHAQNSASSRWDIDHGLGRFPSVSIVDSAGSLIYGDVTYNDENSLTVTFTSAFSGKAYLN